VKKTIRFSFLL